MFRSLTNPRSKLTRTRMALAAAPLALAGIAAPLMGAGPWEWRHGNRHTEIVVHPEFRRVVIAPVEVMPCDLHISAYQSRDTIMVFVTGSNRTGGYSTFLQAADGHDGSLRLEIRNIAPIGVCTQAITPFSLNAAMHTDDRPTHGWSGWAKRSATTLEVRVAGQVICVPIEQVVSIS
jgi:hypothetical protein